MANQQNIKAPNNVENAREATPSDNHATTVTPQSIPRKRSADEKWMVQRKLNRIGDRIAKAKMHEQAEMASAAKRLIAEKKKRLLLRKKPELLVTREREKRLGDSRKAKISISEVVKAKKPYQIKAKRAITEEATKREKAAAAIQVDAKSAMTCELRKRECIEMELCSVKEDARKDRDKCEKAEKKVSEIYANAYALNALQMH